MAPVNPPAGNGKRRGGRNRRKGAGSGGAAGAAEGQPHPAQDPSQNQAQQAEGARAPRGPRPIPPALDKLAELYPPLFGAVFRPLKRGIFQDLVAAHPEEFEREALKVALGIHTRSTRYLQSVAAGQQRHDLQGQPVEAMAPEHVHQALVEVHRRRSGRGGQGAQGNPEEMLLKLRARIVANIEASGLSREAYAERVRTRDEAANALLDDALADMAAKTAREEALVRAFESSGKTVEAFADMYGMEPRSVSRSLQSARARAAAAEVAATAALAAARGAFSGRRGCGRRGRGACGGRGRRGGRMVVRHVVGHGRAEKESTKTLDHASLVLSACQQGLQPVRARAGQSATAPARRPAPAPSGAPAFRCRFAGA